MALHQQGYHLLLLRFLNTSNEVMFNTEDKDLKEVAEYLNKNSNLIIKEIKVYERAKTRFVRANKNNFLKSLFWHCTELDQELIKRNFY